MRYLFSLIALLAIAVTAQAGEPQAPRGIVLSYECEQINPKESGFTCKFENGNLTIQLHERQSGMSEAKRKRFNYEFNKIALRYFELGGKGFHVEADFWPPDQKRLCSHAKNRPYYVYGCDDYTSKN